MSKIFAVNAGSSSLKYQLLNMPDETLICEGMIERIGLENSIFQMKKSGEKVKLEVEINDHEEAVNFLIDKLIELNVVNSIDEIVGVGHRVVHGGEKFSQSVVIDDDVEKTIEEVSDLAPLHNPANLIGYRAFKNKLSDSVVHVAVFDTAFHQTMPKESYIYPIDYDLYEKYGIRRYGFHGTSHKYVSERAIDLLGNPADSRIIVCHLGNGASLCAVKNGKSINTSMGLTPLAGIMMGTRSGDVDPAVIPYIMEKENISVDEVMTYLNKKSGMLGVSKISSDSRDVEEAFLSGSKNAEFAIKLYVRRIIDYIGQYIVQLGGCDSIVFTAGIGENSKLTRGLIIKELGRSTGAKIDAVANNMRGEEKLISSEDSAIKVFVIPTNEELMIARDVYSLM